MSCCASPRNAIIRAIREGNLAELRQFSAVYGAEYVRSVAHSVCFVPTMSKPFAHDEYEVASVTRRGY